MISNIDSSILQLQEDRPETSKCQRAGKFNKTLTSFHPNDSLEQQGKQAYAQQQNQMNATGFNFRQNRIQEAPGRSRKPLQEQQQQQQQFEQLSSSQNNSKKGTLRDVADPFDKLESTQQMSQTSSGFNKQTVQNQFQKGITLEEYFHTGSNMEAEETLSGRQNLAQGKYPNENQFKNEFQEEGSFRSINCQEESDHAVQEEEDTTGYNQNAFEIHEESDEEEEEELEHRRKKKKKQGRICSPKNISDNNELQEQKVHQDFQRQPSQLQENQGGSRSNNQDEIQVENTGDKADDFIQKKIREKYFRKTIHKPIAAVSHQQSGGSNAMSFVASSSTSHNFYASNTNQMQNNPNGQQYSGNISGISAGRKTNRSQSPLQAFKRQSNGGNFQQRCVSKDVGESMESADEEFGTRKTFYTTGRKNNQQQHMNLQSGVYQPYDSDATMENHIAFRSSFYSKGQILTNSTYGAKQRLTVNDFYKNPGGKMASGNYDERMSQNQLQIQLLQQQNYQLQQAQLQRHPQNYQTNDFLSAETMRTAKENKFLNQKDKIQEMAKEDDNFITKHAARFNLNPSELASIKHKN